MTETLELKLSEEETYELVKVLTDFYGELHTIQDYFLARKKDKVKGIDHTKYIDKIFNDFNMEPKDMDFEVELIDGKTFNNMVQIIISLPLESQIGRQITLGIKEKNTGKYVGFVRLASPVLSIKPRNDLFGEKLQATQVNKHMYNGSIIVPVQPFGYNYLGGKLLALLTASHEARNMWDEKYGDKVTPCFMETTSLYGDIKGVSQYDGLKPWIKYGDMTESDLFLFPTEDIYMLLRNRMRELYGREEWKGGIVDPKGSGPKMREFNKIISILKLHLRNFSEDDYKEFLTFTKEKMKTKTKKRYYYSTLGYENIMEHIKDDEPLKKRENWDKYNFDRMVEWWKKKAQKRFENVKEQGRLKPNLEIYTEETINNREIEMVR